MNINFDSIQKINSLKNGIENITGETYLDLTEAIQELKNGYKQGGSGDDATPEYTRLDYLQFNKDKRFDTNIICNQNTKIKVVYTRDGNDANSYIYGIASANYDKSITAYLPTNDGSGNWRFGKAAQSLKISTNEDVLHTAIVSKTGIIQASGVTSFSSVSNFETEGTLIIGACRNSNGSVGATYFVGKIYEFKIWDNNELVLDLIPCINKNGVEGFYDNITHQFIESM